MKTKGESNGFLLIAVIMVNCLSLIFCLYWFSKDDSQKPGQQTVTPPEAIHIQGPCVPTTAADEEGVPYRTETPEPKADIPAQPAETARHQEADEDEPAETAEDEVRHGFSRWEYAERFGLHVDATWQEIETAAREEQNAMFMEVADQLQNAREIFWNMSPEERQRMQDDYLHRMRGE